MRGVCLAFIAIAMSGCLEAPGAPAEENGVPTSQSRAAAAELATTVTGGGASPRPQVSVVADSAETDAVEPRPDLRLGTAAAEELEPQLVLPPDALATEIPARGETTNGKRIGSVDQIADEPTLATARWVGFTPALYDGGDSRPGAWIAGPFDRQERTGWITDTSTGVTTRVTFLWHDNGRTPMLSQDAARALGLRQGDSVKLAVYLPR